MISLEDCIALSGLTEEEILAIATHERIPEIAASALAQYIMASDHGAEKVGLIIVDDIREAQAAHDSARVLTLLHVLHHYLRTHPEACPGVHPWSRAV